MPDDADETTNPTKNAIGNTYVFPMAIEDFKRVRLVALQAHQELEDVPEQSCDGSEQSERSTDVLVGWVTVENFGGVVKDVARHQEHHRADEPGSEGEPEDHSCEDGSKSDQTSHPKEGPHEAKVGSRQHHDSRQRSEGEDRQAASLIDDFRTTAKVSSNEEQGNKNAGFR